ncbi:MAG: polyamine aminopropyltransferase [Firmicutes bacterium]|nr:polyamine aminopropyltransferase [Candidatus Fermentithermobacillaceae bacterium]
MELWFTEEWIPSLKLSVQVKSLVHKTKTKFQELAVYDTEALGRILVLDDVIQTTEVDEHIYHECLVHVPLLAHPNPEEVLIVGGGDGGSLREVLKHRTVKRATLVDIDEGVIEASKKFLPQWNTGFSDPRARVVIANGLDFVAEAKEEYDVVIVDSTDPIGPGEALFREEFYRSIKGALRPGGIMAAQTENPIFMPDIVKMVFGRISSVFPVAKLYTGPMPTYPGGFWSYTCATLGPDPSEPARDAGGIAFRYYSPEIHRRAFVLAPEVAKDLSAR